MNVESALQAAPASRDSLGCSLGDLARSQQLDLGPVCFYRKQSTAGGIERVETPASMRGVLLGMSLSEGHRRRIFQGTRRADHGFARDGIYLRDFADHYRADTYGSFDFLLLELSGSYLASLAAEADRPRWDGLPAVPLTTDAVLAHLCRAALPSLEQPDHASPLFLEQLALAIGTHILQRYAGMSARAPAGGRSASALSPLHEQRAKDMLMGNLSDNVPIAEVAQACRMSRSYFMKAFKQTTGQTPYQWLIAQRLQRAMDLLRRSDLSLADIAVTVGFSDQSHFTRVFSQVKGETPGRWRKRALG